MKRIVMSVLLLALATAGLAQAAELATMREGHWDFSLQTRYVPSQDFTNANGSALSLSDDLGWGFGFGYNVSDQLNIGFNWTWRGMNYTATVQGDQANEVAKYSNWLDTSTLALSGEYSLLRSKISPYVNGSFGWTFIDTNIVADYDYGCWWDPWWGYVCSGYEQTYGTEAFTYSAGAGLRMELTPTVFMRVGYEHGWMDIDNYDGVDMFRVDLGSLF